MAYKKSLTYSSTGVNYSLMDPLKKLAQKKAKETSINLKRAGFMEVSESRGESAYVWEEKDSYKAFVIEGLGTKNLVADAMGEITGKSYYKQIAQDSVAAIVNDLIVVGAKPLVVNAYFGAGHPSWFKNIKRQKDLIEGFAKACNLAGATWGGGETPTLKGIINPYTLDLGGSGIGIIQPKKRLTLGDKLKGGDLILLIESSGIHANGITLTRTLAKKLPQGYKTKLSSGQMFGEAILIPSFIYANLVQDLFAANIDIHYMVNITGHGWRKLMRATQKFSYIIENVPPYHSLFDFIHKHSANSNEEMYGNFNMGAGFAIFLPKKDLEKAQKVCKKNKFKSYLSGYLEKGQKKVLIKPKNIEFKENALGVR